MIHQRGVIVVDGGRHVEQHRKQIFFDITDISGGIIKRRANIVLESYLKLLESVLLHFGWQALSRVCPFCPHCPGAIKTEPIQYYNRVIKMAFRYKFGEEEIKETEQARKKNKDKRAEARLKALELRAKGAEARLSAF